MLHHQGSWASISTAASTAPPQRSLQELSLTGNAIVLTQRAVERLAAALPHIQRLHLNPLPPHPASVAAVNGSEGSMWHEHGQALAQLVHLMGRRLALEQ